MPSGARPRGVVRGERVGVVGDVAAADVLVAEVAADEALVLLLAGDAANAPERRQIQEPLIVGAGMFPDEEAGVADVVRVGEADQRAVALALLAAHSEHRQDAFAHAALAVEQPHTHLGAGVAAGVAVADLAGHPFGRPVRLGGDGVLLRCRRRERGRDAGRRRGARATVRFCEPFHNAVKFAEGIGDTPAKRPHPRVGCPVRVGVVPVGLSLTARTDHPTTVVLLVSAGLTGYFGEHWIGVMLRAVR